jgi:hypothetical protein
MVTITGGLVGGIVATIVMTALMMALGDDSPPPTAMLVAKFADGDPEDYAMPGMALHFLYGIGAGAAFAVALPFVIDDPGIAVAAGLGLAYGIVLMVVGMAFWMRGVIGLEPDRDTVQMFAIVHVVYGVVLGAVAGAGLFA